MRSFVLMVAVAMLGGCGDDDRRGRPDSGSVADSGSAGDSGTVVDSGSVADSGTVADSGPTENACPTDTLRFDINLLGGGATADPSARVVVAWFQLDDDGPDPDPLIAYDEPLPPTATRFDIPLSSIAAPNADNLLCDRACTDEPVCPCLSEPQVGLAVVFVILDADASGSISLAELTDAANQKGVGYVVVGHSDTAHVPAPSTPIPWNELFPDGIVTGTCPYRVVEGTGTFDRLGFMTSPAQSFDLNVCAEIARACDPPFPNIT